MKNIIVRINLANLRNEAHTQYNQTIKDVVDKHNPDTFELRQYYDVYYPLFVEEVEGLDLIRNSKITPEIETQDHIRDRVYRGFVGTVRSTLNHYDEKKQNAAKEIERISKHYDNMTYKTLDEETAALDDFIQELRTDTNREFLTTLGLNDWVDVMEKENRKFEELMQLRYEEVFHRPHIRMKDIRKAVDKALLDMFDQIEALVRVKKIAPDAELIKEINAVNERYKNILAQQKGRRDKKHDSDQDLQD
jgi:hypothetical protein